MKIIIIIINQLSKDIINFKMNINCHIFLLAIVLLNLSQTKVNVQPYSKQGTLSLVSNVYDAGYSKDQQSFILLPNNISNYFTYYPNIQLSKPINVTIQPSQFTQASTFAFTPDNKWLIIGTYNGQIYCFQISKGNINPSYTYRYYCGTPIQQNTVNQISISLNNKIALAAKDKILILSFPPDQSSIQLILVAKNQFPMKILSVKFKGDDDCKVLLACFDGFYLYNLNTYAVSVINQDSTTTIGVFSDGTVLQGRLNKQVQILQWNQDKQTYSPKFILPNTVGTTKILVSSSNLYFSIYIPSPIRQISLIMAFKSYSPSFESSKQINQKISINPVLYLSTTGPVLVMSNNGNQILVQDRLQSTWSRHNLCNDGYYYAEDSCQLCPNQCNTCLSQLQCFNCKPQYFITSQNKCQDCTKYTPGCKLCTDFQHVCTRCDPLQHWKITPQNGKCSCISTYYLSENVCLSCQVIPNCNTCINQYQCTNCDDSRNVNPVPYNGQCICKEGFYMEDYICRPCSASIIGCLYCISSYQCIVCDVTAHRKPMPINGQCQCEQGYVQVNHQCVQPQQTTLLRQQ